MVDERITQYIQTTRKNGYSDEAITTRLKESGFSEQAIQEAYASITPTTPPLTQEQAPTTPDTKTPVQEEPAAASIQKPQTSTPLDEPTQPKEKRYAGFWIRTAAVLIDSTIIGTLLMTVMFVIIALNPPTGIDATVPVGALIAYLAILILAVLYEIITTASPWQGTLGKHILGLKVEDENGTRLSIGKSALRHIIKSFLSIAWIVVAFTEKKQGVHDMLAKTYVVRK